MYIIYVYLSSIYTSIAIDISIWMDTSAWPSLSSENFTLTDMFLAKEKDGTERAGLHRYGLVNVSVVPASPMERAVVCLSFVCAFVVAVVGVLRHRHRHRVCVCVRACVTFANGCISIFFAHAC